LRGIEVSHEAIRDWETKLLPIMGEELRKHRHGKRRGPGASWYVEETYLKARGQWIYLCWAVNRDGDLIDATLSGHRDMAAAKAFFRWAKAKTGFRPGRVTTDGHGPYPRAIRTVLGRTVRHRMSASLNNRLEQDHRGIKGRIRCMRGFKSDPSAALFCREHGELRDLLRCRRRHNQTVPATRRSRFTKAARIALGIMQAA
jgi:putative transposase